MDFAKLVAEKAIKEALAQPEQIPPSADSNTHQPERHELQAKGEHPAPCARHCEANAFQIVIKNLKAQLAQPEQEPVAWLLTDKNINLLQVDSIQRLIDRLKHAHHTDIRVRINGHDEWFEADWLKHMVRVTPPQPEQNPMSDEMLQAITDPENQPSQYGTVTLDYHFEKIKKWEDLFERMSNKVLQQPEQEPVAWPCLIDSADFSENTITLVMQCDDYKVSAGTHWLSTTQPKEKK
jgi:hypothetical protein